MEENKIDIYQIIGFLFLIAAFFWWFNVTIPELEQDALEENETISQIQNQDENKNPVKDITEIVSFNASSQFTPGYLMHMLRLRLPDLFYWLLFF